MKKRGMMNKLQCNISMIELLNAYLLADVYLYGFVTDLDFTDDLLQILLWKERHKFLDEQEELEIHKHLHKKCKNG